MQTGVWSTDKPYNGKFPAARQAKISGYAASKMKHTLVCTENRTKDTLGMAPLTGYSVKK